MRKRNGEMTIQYAFLIFLATMTVFIVLGLITKWGFDASKFVCKLTGECNVASSSGDIQKINTTDCNDFQNEIVKHARLCNEKGRQGQLEGNEPICYVISGPTQCSIGPSQINGSLSSAGENVSQFKITFSNSNKAVISYSYREGVVKIE